MLEGFTNWAKEAIKKIASIPSSVVEAVGGEGGMIHGIMEGLSNIAIPWTVTALEGLVNCVPDLFRAMKKEAGTTFKPGVSTPANAVITRMKANGLIDDRGANLLFELTGALGIAQSPALLIAAGMMYTDHLKALGSAMQGKTMQGYNKIFSPYSLDASSAVRAAFIAPEKYDAAFDVLKRNGLSDSDIDLLFLSAYRVHDPNSIRELYYRKIVTIDQARVALRENGFTDRRIDELVQTWALIPGPNDLITMAVREAFDEGQARDLGLDINFPGVLAEWAEKQGLSPYWAKMYWRAHWQLPSPQMGYEMVHRGLITEEELKGLLTALDYSPRWHDALMGINYNLMTRVDLRRVFELGLITADQMEEKYREIGYSPTDAKLLRAWTEVEYNQEYKDITKTEVIKQYLEGIIEESQLVNMLSFMGYTAERIDTMVALASYQRAFAKQSTRVAALRKLYISGDYSLAQVQQELAPFNIDPRRILEIVDQWELERKAGITPPKKAELDRWYMEDIVSESEYVEEMQKIGYSEKNIIRYARSIKLAKEGK